MASRLERWIRGTRGRVLALLRSEPRTVGELAERVRISDNAVRTHLASLQTDGLVEEVGTAHGGGVGKPALLYRATEQGEEVFPKAYAAVLRELVRVIADREGEAELEALLREVGRRAARGTASGDAGDRVRAAAQLVRELGGDVELVPEAEGGWRIDGRGCPLSAVVRDQAVVCTLVEALVAEVTGEAVIQCCRHGERPQCSFRVQTV